MNKEIDPDLLARLEEVTGGESKAPELTPEQEEKLAEWRKRADQQQKGFNRLDSKGRAAYDIKPGESLEDKRRRDEEEHPSGRSSNKK